MANELQQIDISGIKIGFSRPSTSISLCTFKQQMPLDITMMVRHGSDADNPGAGD